MFEQSRRKLTLMYSGLIGVILTALILMFYLILSHSLWVNVDKQLEMTTKQVIGQLNRKSLLPREMREGFQSVPLNQFAVLFSADHTPLLSSSRDEELVNFLKTSMSKGVFTKADGDLVNYGNNWKLKINLYPNTSGANLLVGMDVTDNVDLLSKMKWRLSILAVFVLLVSAGVGYWFAGRAMVPIQRSYQRQQDFVADASHELRTPLSIFAASVEILEEEKNALPPFHQKVLADMKEELTRMTRLIHGLLTLARGDSGRAEINLEIFDLGKTMISVLESFSKLLKETDIRLTYSTNAQDNSIVYQGDEERIKQLLYIILDNALKYNKPGGEIHVELQEEPHELTLTVTDTGVGIPEEQVPLIFERFYRVDKGRSRSQGGTGLGLSIAAWIVEAHGGKIKANSEIGVGTTIQVQLKK